MELKRRLKLKINYMKLETKLGRNTIEIKFVHWYASAKGDIMIRFSKIRWVTWKKTWQGINELLHRRKKNLKVISALKDLNNRNKIVKEGSHSVPRPILLNIFMSLIHSYLTYGLAAWCQAYKTYLNKIPILQKRDLRLLYFTDWHVHPNPIFLETKVL